MALRSKFALIAGGLMLLALLAGGYLVSGQWRAGGASDGALQQMEVAERQPLGLMTSLPIYWRNTGNMAEMLAPADGTENRHWVRDMLEAQYELLPLDTLSGPDGGVAEQLDGIDLLLLAQPYTLTPSDNVALDLWLRDGGRLLMFADPMLTEHSDFALGDRRRPQDVGLVPPVFARWGIAQSVDEASEANGPSLVRWNDVPVPVNLRGRFTATETPPESGDTCSIAADGLVADCTIGAGRSLIVADAAMLEEPHSDEAHGNDHHDGYAHDDADDARRIALRRFVRESFQK